MMRKTKPDKATLERLYWTEEMSLKMLGERFGVDGATVRNWMISYGIPRRDLSKGKKRSKTHGQRIAKAQKRLVETGKRRYDGEHSPRWKGGPVAVACGWCGEPVEVPRAYAAKYENTFCKGTDCRSKWQSVESSSRKYNKPHYAGVDVECHYCGETIRRDQSSIKGKKHIFCDKGCLKLFYNVELICDHCDTTFLRPRYRDKGQKYVFCSRDCKKEGLSGERNYRFKGGYGRGYYGANWRLQRRRARKRDNYACQDCSIHQSKLDRALDVHHIIPFPEFGIENYKEANRLLNLTSLCPACHTKAEHKIRCQTSS